MVRSSLMIEEVKARHGKVVAITTEGNKTIEHIVNNWLYICKTLEMLSPIFSAILIQLLAYYMGIMRVHDKTLQPS